MQEVLSELAKYLSSQVPQAATVAFPDITGV